MIPVSELQEVLISQYEGLKSQKTVLRSLQAKIAQQSEFVSIITGIRRSGKSTLLQDIAKGFTRLRYVNLEDFRLTGFEQKDFINLEKVFDRLAPGCDVYFFDEIQNIPGWENYIRTLNDQKKIVFLTGSNASLLSKELGTKLTGRHLSYELFPMDFFEYCTLKGRKPSQKSIERYLVEGGFPQYIKTGLPEYLQQILSDILYRDIVKRYNIRNIRLLEDLTHYLISHISKEYSLRNISKFLGTDSIHTLSEYTHYLEDAYLFFSIPMYSLSLKKQSVNPRKIYAIDNGLVAANTKSLSKDLGKLLENMVFVQLRRRFNSIYYYRNRGECDFIVTTNNVVHSVIQVCYHLNSENIDRELQGLAEAMQETKCVDAVLITMDENAVYSTQAGKVHSLSFFEWIQSF